MFVMCFGVQVKCIAFCVSVAYSDEDDTETVLLDDWDQWM